MTSTKSSGLPPVAAVGTRTATTGPFMLTLCGLASPVTIRPPQAPQLKSFKFFVSRSRRSDGREQFALHMGYFATLTEAEKWAQVLRRAYPSATPAPVPPALLRQPNSGVPTLRPAEGQRGVAEATAQRPAQVEEQILTDTQVLSVLESRRASPVEELANESDVAQISLLRPEDSGARRVLKEAVVQGAPVSFAVQLLWSVQPIDIARVPSVSIFKAYTLYVTQGRREGRTWHCLRLGFFSDAISAKQVAHFVRPSYASVAVVPITEQERTEASQARIDPTTLADPLANEIDSLLDADRSRSAATDAGSTPARSADSAGSAPARSANAPSSAGTAQPKSMNRGPAAASKGRSESLEQTLELLASSEIWNNEDSLSETGVRHLTVQVQKPASRRS